MIRISKTSTHTDLHVWAIDQLAPQRSNKLSPDRVRRLLVLAADPDISTTTLSLRLGISRRTVTKYLAVFGLSRTVRIKGSEANWAAPPRMQPDPHQTAFLEAALALLTTVDVVPVPDTEEAVRAVSRVVALAIARGWRPTGEAPPPGLSSR